MEDVTPQAKKVPPVCKQVEDYLRDRILSGELPGGTRLPPNEVLAKQVGTSRFTIQTALDRLRVEGLVSRQPKVGTFVRREASRISCVGLYLREPIGHGDMGELSFYQEMCRELKAQFALKGIAVWIWSDDRPEHANTILPSLATAIAEKKIQGLIGVLTSPDVISWLDALDIPAAFISKEPSITRRVATDNGRLLLDSLTALKKDGCRSIGLISSLFSTDGGFTEIFAREVERHGLRTQKQWIRQHGRGPGSKVQYGYEQFHELWSLKERPEGLLVWPDHAAYGVVTAILERRIDVPEELKLAVHANSPSKYVYPLECHLFVMDIENWARELIEMMQRQLGGQPVETLLLPARLKLNRPVRYRREALLAS